MPTRSAHRSQPDPFAPRDHLPPRQAFQHRRASDAAPPESGIEGFRPVPQELPVIGRGEPGLIRTALAIEPRDGKMHIFLPPLFALEDWLDLLAAIEETAEETGQAAASSWRAICRPRTNG